VADRKSEIIRLWNENIGAKEIGIELGVTKNVVIGVVTRARQSGDGSITRAKGPSTYTTGLSKKGKRSHKKRENAPKVRAISLPRLFQAPPVEEPRDANIVGVSLLDLGQRSCRYPTSRVEDQHYFCGATTRDYATSYCAEHHGIVWVKKNRTTPKERAMLRNAYLSRQWIDGSVASSLKGRN
jgi:hypothetical protein